MELVRRNLESIVFERILAEVEIEKRRAVEFKHFSYTCRAEHIGMLFINIFGDFALECTEDNAIEKSSLLEHIVEDIDTAHAVFAAVFYLNNIAVFAVGFELVEHILEQHRAQIIGDFIAAQTSVGIAAVLRLEVFAEVELTQFGICMVDGLDILVAEIFDGVGGSVKRIVVQEDKLVILVICRSNSKISVLKSLLFMHDSNASIVFSGMIPPPERCAETSAASAVI